MLYDIDHDDGTLVAWLSPDESDGHTHRHAMLDVLDLAA